MQSEICCGVYPVLHLAAPPPSPQTQSQRMFTMTTARPDSVLFPIILSFMNLNGIPSDACCTQRLATLPFVKRDPGSYATSNSVPFIPICRIVGDFPMLVADKPVITEQPARSSERTKVSHNANRYYCV